ncbi:F-box/LRR-repeat protein 6-like [Corticium candelabrum]|uniref:F-box/LRR-repeat protein 6-like n=1 Tax=Corticium candelabrum TaxID=121492 RepID=UPI002E2639FA|nr:F-box/LRR-repeat protein 6-like [Corticium candelabrum]
MCFNGTFSLFGDTNSSDCDDPDWISSSDSESNAHRLRSTAAANAARVGRRRKRRRERSTTPGNTVAKKQKYTREIGEQISGMDLWGQIVPAEILATIFGIVVGDACDGAVAELLRLRRVCTHWQRVSLLPKLWKRVSLVNLPGLTNGVFTRLCSRELQHTVSLKIVGCAKIQKHGYMAIADHCRQLQQLTVLRTSTFTAAPLQAITKLDQLNCLRLEELTSGINTRWWIELINARGSQLTGLSLAGCPRVGRSVISSIVDNCFQLTYLDLSSINVGTLNVDLLQRGCPLLTALHLDHLTLRSSIKSANKSMGFKDLNILTLACSDMLPCVPTVKMLLYESSILETLDIRGWRDPDYNSLVSSLPGEQNLRRLFVARWKHVDIASFMAAISVYKQLIELDLNQCVGINDSAVTRLAQTQAASSLKILHLSGTAITNAGLHAILAVCLQLESLDLTSCRGVSRGLKQVHNRDSIQQMRNKTLC